MIINIKYLYAVCLMLTVIILPSQNINRVRQVKNIYTPQQLKKIESIAMIMRRFEELAKTRKQKKDSLNYTNNNKKP